MKTWYLMRKLILILCLLITQNALANDKLRVGTMYFIAPYVVNSGNGVYTGFDVLLLQKICKMIKKECIISQYQFENLFKALDDNKIDIALGGLVITNKRKEKYSFTLPYLLSNGIFFIRNNKKISSIEELKGKKIGILKSSVFETYINEKYPNFFKIVYVGTNQDVVDQLYKGNIDAGIMLQPAASYWISKSKGDFTTLGRPIKIGEGIGMITLKKNQKLVDEINNSLKIIENNGTYIKLYNLYSL
jgi:ABC-type amino acid transport substrate-binding protein